MIWDDPVSILTEPADCYPDCDLDTCHCYDAYNDGTCWVNTYYCTSDGSNKGARRCSPYSESSKKKKLKIGMKQVQA